MCGAGYFGTADSIVHRTSIQPLATKAVSTSSCSSFAPQYLTSRGVFVVPTAPSELYQDEFETVVRPEIVKADIRRTQI
jgi:hypothetical protein